MIYELPIDGYRLGIFPTEAEVIHRVGYLSKDSYTIREWAIDGEFSTFNPTVNKHFTINN